MGRRRRDWQRRSEPSCSAVGMRCGRHRSAVGHAAGPVGISPGRGYGRLSRSRRDAPAQLANPTVLHLFSPKVFARPDNWQVSATGVKLIAAEVMKLGSAVVQAPISKSG